MKEEVVKEKNIRYDFYQTPPLLESLLSHEIKDDENKNKKL